MIRNGEMIHWSRCDDESVFPGAFHIGLPVPDFLIVIFNREMVEVETKLSNIQFLKENWLLLSLQEIFKRISVIQIEIKKSE